MYTEWLFFFSNEFQMITLVSSAHGEGAQLLTWYSCKYGEN